MQGGYWGYIDMMLWVLWLPLLEILCVGLCCIRVAGNWTFITYVVVCFLLASGREIPPPKWNVKGFNHWMGQIFWIKEEWFIALRDICHLSERLSAVPTLWHVADLSEAIEVPDRRSLPTFAFAAFLTMALCTNVLYGSLQKSCLSYAHYKMKICLPDR